MLNFLRCRCRGLIAIACSATLVAGCSVIPTQGPYPSAVTGQEPGQDGRLPYILAEVTPDSIAVFETQTSRSFGATFSDKSGPIPFRLGTGDIVTVTIFEAAAGGLFIPSEAGSRPGNFISLPAQEVSRAGTISVPFAGEITAAGRTTQDVQNDIQNRLKNRAIEPQAVVTLSEARSSLVSVAGEVSQPVRFPISRSGDRLLDAITRAGGSRWPNYETYVTLQRGKQVGTVYFNKLVSEPSNNIYIQPGDTIIVKRESRNFMALGASGQNGQINFEQEELKLSEAIGRAGSILDARGDPAQTFVYRLEPRQTLVKLGYSLDGFEGATIPVIYKFNLRDPQGFFLATKFPMQPRDILFVSNAASVEFLKIVNLIQQTSNTITDSDVARISLKGGRR